MGGNVTLRVGEVTPGRQSNTRKGGDVTPQGGKVTLGGQGNTKKRAK